MEIIRDIISNKAIVIPIIAWFIAQLLKVIDVIIKEKKLDFTRFISSGGMPSAHTSFIVSLTAVIGKNYGVASGEFAISLAVALIVMYDAAGVRRAAGKQAEVLNKLIFSYNNDKIQFNENLKELIGHTPFEVVIGAVLGGIIGIFFG